MTSNLISFMFVLACFSKPTSQAQSDCSALFFTPAWQECFRAKFQNLWDIGNPSGDNFVSPIEGINLPQGHFSMSSMTSSSFSSGGNSKSVISSNGRSWTIQSNRLPIFSASDDTGCHVQVHAGEPSNIVKTFGNDNSLRLDLTYPDGTTAWITVTLNSPTPANSLVVETRNGVLCIDGAL